MSAIIKYTGYRVNEHKEHIYNDILLQSIYYIKINEIQENTEEITCIFQKVLFSLVKNIKCYFTSEKYQLLDDFRFFHKFPL